MKTIDLQRSSGFASDTAEYQPPTMRVLADGAHMETYSVSNAGGIAAQVTIDRDNLQRWQVDAILATLRAIS